MKKGFIVILLLFAALSVCCENAQAGKFPPGARRVLSAASAMLKEDKSADAEAVLKAYLMETKEDVPVEVYLFLGTACHRSGSPEEALVAFQSGYDLYPQNEKLCRNLAVLLHAEGRVLDAAPLLVKAFRLSNPAEPQLLYQAGAAYYSAGEYAASAEVMAELLSGKDSREQWIQLGVYAFIRSGQLERAQQALYARLETDPQDALCWEMLAKVYMDRNLYLKAAAALECSCRLKEEQNRNVAGDDYERLAAIYNYCGANLRSAQALEKAYGPQPEPDKAKRIAALYMTAGRYEQAIAVLQEAVSKQPDLAVEQARILYASRRFDKAGKLLSEFIDAYPSNSEARLFSAFCAWEKRDWSAAMNEFSYLLSDKDYSSQAESGISALKDLNTLSSGSIQ